MQRIVSKVVGTLRQAFLLVVFMGLMSAISWFNLPTHPAYAASSTDEYLQEIKRDQAAKDRQEAYQQAAEITEDPKMGVEKEYEAEVNEYFEEHPGEGGVLQDAKNLVNKVTGQDK